MTRNWRTGGWLVASALLWVGVGVAGSLLFLRNGDSSGSGNAAVELAAALEVLDLSAEQRDEVDQVLSAYGDSVLALHRPVDDATARFWEQVLHAEQDADQAIAAILTEEQRRRYEDLILGRSGNLDRSGNGNRR